MNTSGHKKKKTLFYGCNRPRFSILVFLFFFFFQLCKTNLFCSKSQKIWLKVFGNNWKSFSKIFLQKHQDWGNFIVFRGVLFATRTLKKKSRPTDQLCNPSWKVSPPVKQGFFFCGLMTNYVYRLKHIKAIIIQKQNLWMRILCILDF